ncbi:MAG: KH domain-containing protein [SAR202 cluster bacterium]|nr:KH domain-containing protein [SAR202 cluster bacterium]
MIKEKVKQIIKKRRRLMNPKIFKGRTVEEATEEALKTLNEDLENLEIKIIDTGRNGILGLGGHPAEIEVYVLGAPNTSEIDEKPKVKQKKVKKDTKPKRTTSLKKEPKKTRQTKNDENIPTEKDPEIEEVVGKILNNLINSTGLDADVYVRDQMEEGSIVFELEGQDSGLLIGRRGETLSSLEYLVRLMASKTLDKRANIMIDVEDYKLRRKEKLENIAKKTAEKVSKTGKRISLEPMSAADRRIVHMTLAESKNVSTQSRGEGMHRKVVINPVNE